MGVRRAGNHIDAVTRIYQGLAEVIEVNTLAAGERLAAVAQQRNAQRLARDSFTRRGRAFD